jgi:ribosomal protein L11 methyltransferase
MAGKVKKYDVVIANIVADVIIALSYTVSEFLKEKGIFIVSGIINERADEVREKLIDNGFKIICENTLDGWTEFELTK